jgi:hypothetical protein
MHPPLILKALLGLLLTLAVPGSLAAFVIAGFKLRSEGGTNYQASDGFPPIAISRTSWETSTTKTGTRL